MSHFILTVGRRLFRPPPLPCLVGCLAFALLPSTAFPADVTVDVMARRATMPLEGLGLVTAVFEGGMGDDLVPVLVRAAGIKLVRLGGSYADIYHWQTHSTTGGTNYVPPSASFSNFMSRLVIPAGATAMITVNYGSNPSGAGGADPEEAAAWVRFANVTMGYGIKYWEIGNEVYGNRFYGGNWEMDLHPDCSPMAYGSNVDLFVRAMKAADPTIKIGAVLTTLGYWPDRLTPNWNRNVLQRCGKNIDFVIVHFYPDGGDGNRGGARILSKTAEIPGIISNLRALINTYCGTNAPNVQIAVTETGGGNFDTNSAPAEALFAADDYLTWIEHGAVSVDWQDLTYYFLPDSHRPGRPYYGAMMARLLADVGDPLLVAACYRSKLRVHAAAQQNGIGVLLINEDAANEEQVTVTVNGVPLANGGTVYQFGRANYLPGSALPSSGPTTNSLSSLGSQFTISVPAYTMINLSIPAATNLSGVFRLVPGLNASAALDLDSGSAAEGARARESTWNNSAAQNWLIQSLGNGFHRLSPQANTNVALEVESGKAAENAAIIMVKQWNAGARQQWALRYNGDGTFRLAPGVNAHAALSVRDGNPTDGTPILTSAWIDAPGQRWYVIGNNP